MPALSQLSLAQHRFGSENHQTHDTAAAPAPAPSPLEARIQSWAGNVQPTAPVPLRPQAQAQPPRLGAWTPDMGIRFAHAPPPQGFASGPEQIPQAGQNQGGRAQAWDPSAGIRFGRPG